MNENYDNFAGFGGDASQFLYVFRQRLRVSPGTTQNPLSPGVSIRTQCNCPGWSDHTLWSFVTDESRSDLIEEGRKRWPEPVDHSAAPDYNCGN